MANFKMKMHLEGVKELVKQLKALADPKTAKKIQRRAATAAIKPMRKAVQGGCPVDSVLWNAAKSEYEAGGLRKSIESKVSVKGHGVSAIVGSNTAILESGKKAQEKDEGPRAARHLHLVLFGHITDSGGAVPGNNFLERGFNDSVGQAQSIYESKLRDGLEQAVKETG